MKIHILEALEAGRYRAVLHAPVPAGNNSAGVPWKAALVGAGLNKTALPVGTLPGTIDALERDAVVAGDVLEIVTELRAETGGATPASLTQMADRVIADRLQQLAARLKFFGYTQAT